MNTNEIKQKIKKASKWILLKKQRHEFKNEIINFLDKIENETFKARKEILEHYANLTTPTEDKELKKQLFKQSVKLIEIEIASFCNRKCWFCPNSFVDKTQNVRLDESVYVKIIRDLA